MPTSSETAARKQKFLTNLQRLMRERRLSVPETARRAGIQAPKRFYRWANSGIARAAHAHHEDLEGLRRLFRLSTIEELWGDPPEVTVMDQLMVGISAKPEYAYAVKLLFVLERLPEPEADTLRRQIDDAFNLETRHELPQSLMPVLTGRQVLHHVRRRSEKAYTNLVKLLGDDPDEHLDVFGALLTEDGISDPIAHLIENWENQDAD